MSSVATAFAFGAMLTMSACGSTDDPGGSDTSTTSSPSNEPTASAPDPKAGWHVAEDDGGRFFVPPDWDVEEGDTGLELQAPRQREGGVRVGGGSLGSSPTIDSSDAIDDAGDTALEFHRNGSAKVERLPDVTFGGVRFYHVRGEDSAQWLDDYGTVDNGQLTTVLWTFNREMVDRGQTDELIDQVMSTFEPTS